MKYLIDFFNNIIFVCAFLSPVSKVTKQSQNFQDIVKTLDDVSEGLALFGDFTDWQIDCAHFFFWLLCRVRPHSLVDPPDAMSCCCKCLLAIYHSP